jgi:plastocyanin
MNRTRTLILGLVCLSSALATRAADLRVAVKDQRGKAIVDAVIVAVPADPKNMLHGKPPADSVDQVDKQFVPYVTPIYVGSRVRFPNSDNIRHQVYSFSSAKKFELPLYGGTDAAPVLFDKPGVVVLGCNIHDWMIGYIYVSETPFFAKTGAAGTATLVDLPAGDYRVRIWHPGMERSEESTTRQITVNADATPTVAWELILRPNFRVPRMSGSSSSGYP